jgi:hypothetical protein
MLTRVPAVTLCHRMYGFHGILPRFFNDEEPFGLQRLAERRQLFALR